jgi:hypothetical protein
MGREAHRAVAAFLARGYRDPSPLEIMAEVGKAPIASRPHVHGLAARQFLAACVSVYFRFFLPGEEWTFIDSELGASSAPLDLVFAHCSGAVRADELKTTRLPKLTDREKLDRQLAGELAGGAEFFGARFDGVRVLFVAAPKASFFVDRDGVRTPLRALEDT